MRKLTLLLSFLILTSSLTACAREGFEDSLHERENLDPVIQEAEKDMSSEAAPEEESSNSLSDTLFMDFDTVERNENNLYIAYSLPKLDGIHDEVATMITNTIESTLNDVVGRFDISKEGAYINIYDSVGAITDDIVSLFYEGEYFTPSMKEPTIFAYGLNFNARTGGQYTISQIMKPHTMATLILDEQSSRILGKDEEVNKAKRKELNSMGMSNLADRIIAADSQDGVDNLFAFSFYLEKGNLVAIVPMSDDSMAPAYIELMNDKV